MRWLGLLLGTVGIAACSSGDAPAPASSSPADDDPPPPTVEAPITCAPDQAPAAAFDLVQKIGPSAIDVVHGFRFAIDPDGSGEAKGWAKPSFDDSAWSSIDAGRSWESQGTQHDGLAWYRRTFDAPASWKGDSTVVIASGVDDEYDVFVNGTHARHHGAPGHSVWDRTTETEIGPLLVPGKNTLAIRVRDWGGDGGIVRKIVVRHLPPLAEEKAFLPEPILGARPDFVDLYWRAWEIAWKKIAFGTKDNGFVPAYLDEGFNEQVYQWDSSFMALFARYGLRLFPAMAALDNFYAKQRPDGYIQRVYSETNGKELGEPTPDEPMINPPLFAWIEHEYFRFSGDGGRLARVYPVLERYWRWVEKNARAPEGKGLYYQTDLGSGMDNTPRGDVHRAAWVDMSAQQALAARSLASIAAVLGDADAAASWNEEHATIAARIEEQLWHEGDGFYYDGLRSGAPARVKHIGAFWTLVAGVASKAHAMKLVEHLRDPNEFARPHPFPSLAANEPSYVARGHYWRGGVWAPTNYMVMSGLRAIGEDGLAREAAEKHLRAMSDVAKTPPSEESVIAPDERDGTYGTIWECYSPESSSPGTRWDDTFLCRQDFVGWSGLGPIAMLFEDVIGIRVNAAERRVVWLLTRADEHGARRMPFGPGHTFDLVARPRASAASAAVIDVRAERGFKLEVQRPGRPARTIDVCPGVTTLTLD